MCRQVSLLRICLSIIKIFSLGIDFCFGDGLGEGEGEVSTSDRGEVRLLALPLASESLVFAGKVGADCVFFFHGFLCSASTRLFSFLVIFSSSSSFSMRTTVATASLLSPYRCPAMATLCCCYCCCQFC